MEIPPLFKHLLYSILILPCFCMGQITENFSDGDFTNMPAWSGDVLNFMVNTDFQLQLNDMDAGSSFLFTPIENIPEMEWQCWIKQAFSPSGNNYARVYLLADSLLSQFPPDGIYLQLGEGGSDDAITLMQQLYGDTSTLIRGKPGAISSSFESRVKVIFANNAWQLLVDYSGGENYFPEGDAISPMFPSGGYFGLLCNYTSSNSKKFYFDDIYVGPEKEDSIPPQVIRVFVRNPNLLELHFSERPETESVMTLANYTITPAVVNIDSVHINEDNPLSVFLFLNDTLPYADLMQLSVQNIVDPAGNVLLASQHSFAWYFPGKYDVIINEIMADPSPPNLLPEYEYLELYNTTSLPLDISNWTLRTGSTEKVITEALIAPQGYIILGKEVAKDVFSDYGDFYGFESFSLTNGGQSIFLNNSNGMLMAGLEYADTWYHDDNKMEGGWSMELINPGNPCLTSLNWQAATDYRGGTPGTKNSVFDETNIFPEIISVCVMDSVRIGIIFNQTMSYSFVMATERFSIDHGIGRPVAILPNDPFFTSFTLYPAKPLLPGILYELSCDSYLPDCLGDSVFFTEKHTMGLPRNPEWQDLVINEILFNPFSGGDDYVEIYNRSQNAISLSGLVLASVKNNPPGPADTSFSTIYNSCSVLLPESYALLCKRFKRVDNYYSSMQTESFQELVVFPAYSNEKGEVLLMDKSLNLLDKFSYREDMHYPLLNSTEGVSLERIHYDRPTQDESNWHSASSLAGFGTPGYKNSQFSEFLSDDGNINISPRVFTPGSDGVNDFININYVFDHPGYLANIMIFNTSGQLTRRLLNNELLGTSGSYSWDGTDDDRQKASVGMYVILIELTDLSGKIVRYKKTAIIAP